MKQLMSVLVLLTFGLTIQAQDVRTFKSVADMRLLPLADTDSSFLYFVSSRKDIDAFRYDPTDNTSTDDSVMVVVSTSGKRLKRNLTGVLYPDWWGAKGDGVTDDTEAFNKMFSWLQRKATGGYIVMFKQRTYLLEDTVFLPMTITATPNRGTILNIQAYGVQFKKNSSGPMFYRLAWAQYSPAPGAALTIINSYSLKFAGAQFTGNLVAGSVALKLGAFYQSVIEDCKFNSFDTATVLPFWLEGTIRNNQFGGSLSVGLLGTSGNGYWPGATNSNSSFNMNQVFGNRVFNRSGALAGVMFLAADGLNFQNHISEGNNPRYDIYFDYLKSTVINGSTFRNLWFESTGGALTLNTSLYISSSGTIDVGTFQNNYADTLIEFGYCNNAVFNISNIQYIGNLPNTKIFKVSDFAAGQINVNNTHAAYADYFTDTARWTVNPIPFRVVSSTVTGLKTSLAYTLDPYTHLAEGPYLAKAIILKGGLYFGTDNVNNIGLGPTGNFRPFRIYVGDGGIAASNSNTGGFIFGASGVNLNNAQAWRYVNDSVTRFQSTGSFRIPIGTTAQRPANFGGGFRYNSSLLRPEFNNGSTWLPVADTAWVLTQTHQTISQTINTNTSIAVGAARMVTVLLVKPASALTNFKVGLTSGGNELVPDQALPAGSWKAFTLSQFFEAAGNIYFSGITASTEIKLVQITLN